MEGLHILANFYQCQFDFKNEITLIERITSFCEKAGLQVVGKSHFQFAPQGLTFTLLLAESHVSVHTWPENGNVAFDIYTCNYQSNNNNKTRFVFDCVSQLLNPATIEYKEIQRQKLD